MSWWIDLATAGTFCAQIWLQLLNYLISDDDFQRLVINTCRRCEAQSFPLPLPHSNYNSHLEADPWLWGYRNIPEGALTHPFHLSGGQVFCPWGCIRAARQFVPKCLLGAREKMDPFSGHSISPENQKRQFSFCSLHRHECLISSH